MGKCGKLERSDNMKHLVFGTGLIGGFIAGGLIEAGFETQLLGREKHQQAMCKGLVISDLNGHSKNLPAPSFLTLRDGSNANETSTFDIVWLAVKATAVERCLTQLEQLITPATIIICCQNGFGSDCLLRSTFPKNTVLSAVVGFNVAEKSGSHLHRSTDGSLVLESHAKLNDIFLTLNTDTMPTHIVNDIEAQRWAKLQLNLANPVNALADIPTKAMVEDPEYRKVIVALMKELLEVTKAKGIELPKLTPLPARFLPKIMSLPNWLYLILAQKTLAIDPTARVSMWWDLSQDKPSEINYLNQAVVDEGKKWKVACPYNERIVQLIYEVEQGTLTLGLSGIELQKRLGII